MAARRSFWLVKSEPDCFSIQHLARSPKQTTCWSGVRNYQARNFMRAMKVGDGVLFYHSSADPPSVVGTAVVAREAYPDRTALDLHDDHYDPKATRDQPIWEMVDIRLEEIFARPVPIGELRGARGLAGMELLRTGSRLSVQPVRPNEFEFVRRLGAAPAPAGKKAKPAKKTSRKATPRKKKTRAS